MNLEKLKVGDSAQIGIYVALGKDVAIVPENILKSQKEKIEKFLKVKCYVHNIAESLLNGILAKIIDNKVILSKVANSQDIKFFEKLGFKVLILDSYHAIGNLIVNYNDKVIISAEFDSKTKKKIKDFLEKDVVVYQLNEMPAIGAYLVVNKNGFAVSPSANERDMKKIEKLFDLKGNIATINYGDSFIANGLLVNDFGVLVGELTTGYELIRINDIFFD